MAITTGIHYRMAMNQITSLRYGLQQKKIYILMNNLFEFQT